jgi:hypothetical protein
MERYFHKCRQIRHKIHRDKLFGGTYAAEELTNYYYIIIKYYIYILAS